ncbi:MAG: hypothetical protein ACFB0C_13930 [Leptolyngbyaceae cyanobacterium]
MLRKQVLIILAILPILAGLILQRETLSKSKLLSGQTEQGTMHVPQPLWHEAVNYANEGNAAAQSAQTVEDWRTVASLWEQAISGMQAIPEASSHYDLAQQKAIAYQQNLDYARQKSAITLSATAKIHSQGMVLVSGQTNLPEGFILSINLYRAYSDEYGTNAEKPHVNTYVRVPVSKGQFSAELSVPTVEDVQQQLSQWSQLSGQTALAYSSINEHINVTISGTPVNQPNKVLAVIGGPKGTLLTGPQTYDNEFFRVVENHLKVDM